MGQTGICSFDHTSHGGLPFLSLGDLRCFAVSVYFLESATLCRISSRICQLTTDVPAMTAGK